jgi:mono/diheme cytochrome c family protein
MQRYGLISLFLVAGCWDHPFHQDQKLGGQVVSAARLNHGRDEYQSYCRPCHGERGDGKGFSSYGLRPPPRDFSQGLFKFGHVTAPALPPDEELVKIVRGGLHGTAMLPWDVPDGELMDILQYIKTFPRQAQELQAETLKQPVDPSWKSKWETEEPGKLIEMSQDPYAGGKEQEAVALGEKLYHAKAQCSGCHPAFVTHEKLTTITKEMTGTGQTEFSAEMYLSQPKETEYCLEWKPGWKKIEDRECAHFVKILPPNFTRDKLRTIHEGTELTDLYRTIASGIGGANMPTWKGALKEEELWGLAYYVRSLVMMRDKPEAAQLAAALNDPKNMSWKPAAGTETPGKEAPPIPPTGPKAPVPPPKKG